MRTRIRIAFQAVLLFLVASCTDIDTKLEEMVPADATGVICVDVPQIMEKSGLVSDGKLQFPEILKQAMEKTDESFLSLILSDAAKSGIDINNRLYIFFANKTFSTVVLASVDDNKKMELLLQRRFDGKLTEHDGLKVIKNGDVVCALGDGILLVAQLGKDEDLDKAADIARSIISGSQPTLFADKNLKTFFSQGHAISAFLKHDGMLRLLKTVSNAGRKVERMSALSLFADSGIDAIKASVQIQDHVVALNADIIADKKSDYVQLMEKTLSHADNSFLKAVPVSMKYVASASIKGEQILSLKPVQELLKMAKAKPYIGYLDYEGIVAGIDGPIAVAASPDDTFDGEWNGVMVMKSKYPEQIVNHISSFASAMGQSPQVVKGEYIYEYYNKAITMGLNGDNLYIKMLNYEQTEGYADQNKEAAEFFAKSPLGVFIQWGKGSQAVTVTAGLETPEKLTATFRPTDANGNPTLLLLKTLCELKPMGKFNADDDSESDEFMQSGAIDGLRPVAQ